MDKTNIIQPLPLNNNISICIVGAGASSLLCSILLARAGYKVVVYEQNSKVGRKLLATGNGRCNISNTNLHLSKYHSTNISFVEYVLNHFSYNDFEQLFSSFGFEFVVNEKNRVYPQSLQASSVVQLLLYEAKKYNVEFVLDTKIDNIKYQNQKFQLFYNDTIKSYSKVIVATGTQAMPKLGSCSSGFKIAQSFGHNIIEPFASLVQLCSPNKNISNLNGVKIDAKTTLLIDNQEISIVTAELLFTKYGLSGNTILDISREASYALSINQQVKVKIDIFPHINKDILISKLIKRLTISQEKDKYFWLEGFINRKLIPFLIDNCGIKKTKTQASDFTRKDIITLAYFMKNIIIDINNTKGYETAEVVAGGVDTFEIEKKTMQSKKQKNLYFIGEVLDVDGNCGGYNLHWAWASAYICANSIIK